ncbi:MAG: hypothetical protein LBM59_04010 [Ruminococcus sp.]|jgi:hypothetical protein|nr:hypothetical protein [Ruminococcus sp.]
MKRLSAVILVIAVIFCSCNYATENASIVEEIYEISTLPASIDLTTTESVSETTVITSALETTETTIETTAETTAVTTTDFLSDFAFEATDEENTYILTNISDRFRTITDFGIFAYYVESTGAVIRKFEVYYDERERPLEINYVNGKADLEHPKLWFNPLMEDIPELAVSLSPDETCKIIISPPYGIRPPTVVSNPELGKLTPANYVYNDEGLRIRSDTKTTIYTDDGKEIQIDDEMSPFSSVAYSLDHKEAAFTAVTDNTLYYISAEDMEPVFVDYYVHNFEMAASGDGIAYTDSKGDYANLYLWDGKENHLITENCYLPSRLLISPDGKTVLFQEKVDNIIKYYYYTNGEITFIDEHIEPIAIADGGSIIYYEKDRALYVQKYGDNENRLKVVDYSDKSNSMQYRFNTDNTEMIYADGKYTYIIKNGSDIYETSDEI